jgi:hypothetical protein
MPSSEEREVPSLALGVQSECPQGTETSEPTTMRDVYLAQAESDPLNAPIIPVAFIDAVNQAITHQKREAYAKWFSPEWLRDNLIPIDPNQPPITFADIGYTCERNTESQCYCRYCARRAQDAREYGSW